MIAFDNCRGNHLHNNTIGMITLFSICSKTDAAAFLKKEEKIKRLRNRFPFGMCFWGCLYYDAFYGEFSTDYYTE